MDSTPQTPIATPLLCTQCGGELHPDEGQVFLVCPYCKSTVYIDKSQVVFHWYLAPTLDENKARASLARWMAGNQTVKDLDKKAQLVGKSFEYFPVWYFKYRHADGKEQIVLELAAASSVTELKSLNLPAGDLRNYEEKLASAARTPTVPLEAAKSWVNSTQNFARATLLEQAITHIPLYTFKYTYQGQVYTALVEAATGAVFANIFPAKAEAPYLVAGGLAAIVFLCLAVAPILGAIADSANGFGIGLLICGGLGLVAAPILFAIAAWVAARV